MIARLAKVSRPRSVSFLYSHGMGTFSFEQRGRNQLFSVDELSETSLRCVQSDLKSSRSNSQIDQLNELAHQIRMIRDHLIHSNLRLVIALVKIRDPAILSKTVQRGVVTLMQAVEKFDFERGFRFSTSLTAASRGHFTTARLSSNNRTFFC